MQGLATTLYRYMPLPVGTFPRRVWIGAVSFFLFGTVLLVANSMHLSPREVAASTQLDPANPAPSPVAAGTHSSGTHPVEKAVANNGAVFCKSAEVVSIASGVVNAPVNWGAAQVVWATQNPQKTQ